MAHDSETRFRHLALDDLDDAAVVVQASGLSTPVDELRRHALLAATELVGAWRDGRLVGVAGAIAFGSRGVIGPMSVLPLEQGHGIGTTLLRHVVEWLHHRGATVLTLDATAAGAPLYRRHGFVTDHWTLHLVHREDGLHPTAPSPSTWRGGASISPLPPSGRGVLRTPVGGEGFPRSRRGAGGEGDAPVTVATPEDAAELARFDAPIFGASRRDVLARYLTDYPARAAVLRRGGAIAGYALAQAGRIGPFVATDATAAAAVLAAVMALPGMGGVVVSLPETNQDGLILLQSWGFAEARRLERMRLGGTGHPGDPARIYGITSYALG